MTHTMTEQITVASTLFKEEYGHYPPITDNAKLHQLLDGNTVDNENPRRIPFMSFNKKDANSKGEICDPWKTPYRITYDDKGPLITSAGPDKKFDTKDDITNRDSR